MNYIELKKSLLGRREGIHVEYKREISNTLKFAKCVAAIANGGFGRVYVGIDEGANDTPIIRGVKYDAETHNKDRMVNIIADRIEPKIRNLEVIAVPIKRSQKFVFVISIPPSPYVYGLKENGWRYYIRRSGRVEELDPRELAELTTLKQNYRENMKCRAGLLSTMDAIKTELAERLGFPAKGLAAGLQDKEKFCVAIQNAKMKDVAINFIDIFYDLKDGIHYALDLPHGNLTVEEHECIKDIQECIDDFAPGVKPESSLDVTFLDQPTRFLHLSVVEWIKYAINDMRSGDKGAIWGDLRPSFASYDITLREFIGYVRKLGLPYTSFYENQFCRYLLQALSRTYKKMDALQILLQSMQAKYGKFDLSQGEQSPAGSSKLPFLLISKESDSGIFWCSKCIN